MYTGKRRLSVLLTAFVWILSSLLHSGLADWGASAVKSRYPDKRLRGATKADLNVFYVGLFAKWKENDEWISKISEF